MTGRVDQGEGFQAAVQREVYEELGVEVQIEFLLGTTHFFRGAEKPANELIGVVYCCTLERSDAIRISAEHSEYRWVTVPQAKALLSDDAAGPTWLQRVIERAEVVRPLVPEALSSYYRE